MNEQKLSQTVCDLTDLIATLDGKMLECKSPNDCMECDWSARYKVALGVAITALNASTGKVVISEDLENYELTGLKELYEMAEKYGDVVAMFQLKHRIEDAESK